MRLYKIQKITNSLEKNSRENNIMGEILNILVKTKENETNDSIIK